MSHRSHFDRSYIPTVDSRHVHGGGPALRQLHESRTAPVNRAAPTAHDVAIQRQLDELRAEARTHQSAHARNIYDGGKKK